MKYIMFQGRKDSISRRIPIIFPDFFVHSDVADDFKRRLIKMGYEDVAPVSAGDINVVAHCSGSSQTLGLEVRAADSSIVNMYDYLHGV